MKITFSPQIRNDAIAVRRFGDTLEINGAIFDFSPLPEGGVLPASAVSSEFVIGDVARKGGRIELTLILPVTVDAPHSAAFPLPIIDPPNGVVQLPGGAA